MAVLATLAACLCLLIMAPIIKGRMGFSDLNEKLQRWGTFITAHFWLPSVAPPDPSADEGQAPPTPTASTSGLAATATKQGPLGFTGNHPESTRDQQQPSKEHQESPTTIQRPLGITSNHPQPTYQQYMPKFFFCRNLPRSSCQGGGSTPPPPPPDPPAPPPPPPPPLQCIIGRGDQRHPGAVARNTPYDAAPYQ